jgi:hypothetical protein
MASFDIISDLNLTRGANQTLSGVTPNNSALIDMQGWEAMTVYLETGVVTDAGTVDGFSMKLQHSDSTATGTFVDCTADEVIGANVSVLEDTDDTIIAGGIGYSGNKRYVRAVFTGTTGTNAVVHILALRGRSTTTRPVPAVGSTTAAT